MFSCEFCEIFKNTYFIEHHHVTASLALYALQTVAVDRATI